MAVSPEELKALSRLLDQALALVPSDRAGWLGTLTGPDAEHRVTLAQLLSEADAPDDPFLTRAELDSLRGIAPPRQAGDPPDDH
jgi:hypothetical protein